MAGQGQGISVPISLQISNLQSIVNMLQSKLSNLKVGTTGFKSLQTIIATIQKDIDKLAIQTDKPFISANQFTAADRAVNKLEEDLDKVQIAVSRIKFSDLELDPSQTTELKAFETQIESIKNSLKTVKETAKQAFLDSDVGKSWAENHADAATQTLQQLTTTITKEVQKQKTELEQAKEAISDYQRAIQVSKNINNFMSKRSGHELSEATMGKELFNKIFKTDDAGEVAKFQNGGKTLLQQWLQQQFNLDSATVQNLTEGAGAAVVKAFSEIGGKVEAALKAQQIKLRNTVTEQKTATNNGSTLEAAVKEKAEKLNQTEAVQARIVASNTSVSTSEVQLRAELEQTKTQLAEYKDRLAEVVRTNPDWTNGNKQANIALEQLKSTLSQTNAQFLQQQKVMQNFNSMKMAVVNFMGFNQVLNLTKTAVREAMSHIKELDTVMNGIAIVTDMTTGDLWNQIDQYSKMAQAYGVSITGAYEVSQIYYQQGLETADVLTLTNETLKLAKISGLDYATTTDYMTTAIRGFKMEMSEASTVVDVYSNLAAHTAVSQEELAVAMSKTASSMAGVGATFEEASAMIGTMVAVTRESATNIGSAMKSIASRYGELTKDPTKLVDEEGEAMAFNKVDAALQSVGISMKTVDGQFREFTDVIVELGEKWDELDSTQQRYIATQFAGNRQQSRFLALVSNVDLLKSNLDVAMNSEDTGTLQALKALDSVESKIEQVRVAYQQFYTTMGIESVWKGFLDGAKNVIDTLNSFPKLFGKIPIGAIAAISSIISLIKHLGIDLLSTFAQTFGQSMLQGALQAQGQAQEGAQSLIGTVLSTIKSKNKEFTAAGKENAEAYTQGIQQSNTSTTSNKLAGQDKITYNNNQNIIDTFRTKTAQFSVTGNDLNSAYAILANQMQGLPVDILEKINADESFAKQLLEDYIASLEKANQKLLETGNTAEQSGGKLKNFIANHKNLGQGLQSFGSALNMIAMTINTTAEGGKTWSGVLQGMASAATLAGVAIKVLDQGLKSMPWMALASGVLMAINAISTIIVTPEERLEELTKKAEDLSNKAKEIKANNKTLDNSIKKVQELEKKRYDGAEAAEEYQSAVDDLTDKFPEFIAGFDAAGNVIVDTSNAETILANARQKTVEATYAAAKAELEVNKENRNQAQDKYRKSLSNLTFDANSAANESVSTVESQRYKFLQNIFNSSWIDHYSADTITAQAELLNQGAQGLTEGLYKSIIDQGNLINQLIKARDNTTDSEERQRINHAIQQLQTFIPLITKNTITDPIAELKEQLSQKLNQLKDIDVNSTAGNNLIKEINGLMLQAEQYSEDDGFFAQAIEVYNEFKEELGAYIDANALYQSNKKLVISSWLQEAGTWGFLSESNQGIALLTNQIALAVGEQGDWDNASEDQKKAWIKMASDFQTFWGNLNEGQQKLFESMMANASNYEEADFQKAFGDVTGWEEGNIYNLLYNFYYKSITDYVTNINKKIETITKNDKDEPIDFKQKRYDKLTGDIKDHIRTSLESNYINNLIDTAEQLDSRGLSSYANDVFDLGLQLFKELDGLDAGIREAIYNSISNNGLSTVEGLQAILTSINNNEGIKDKAALTGPIEEMLKYTISNINLSMQVATSNILETFEDTSKELGKAMSGGFDLTEADALIGKAHSLGLEHWNLDTFIQSGDKLLLTAKATEEYWKALDKSNEDARKSYEKKIQSASILARRMVSSGTKITQESITDRQIRIFEEIGFNWEDYFDKETKEWKSEKSVDAFNQALQDAINISQDNFDDLVKTWEIAQEIMKKSWDYQQGNYGRSIKELEQIAQETSFDRTTQEGADRKAIHDSLNEAYNNLISDVLSKGMDRIDTGDYEGLIQEDTANLKAKLEGSYVDFVSAYLAYTGLSIEEQNDLMLQAIEKDNALKSIDILKDFQYQSKDRATTTLSALSEYASRVGVSINRILNEAVISANATLDEYVVDMTVLSAIGDKELDIDAEELQAATQDSINSYWDNIVKLIQSGLNGQLSNADWQSLRRFSPDLAANGYTTGLEGLQLTDESFMTLYGTVSKTNKLLAKSLLPDLIKTSGRYRTLGDVLREFEETTDKARKDMLKDIASSMLRDPDRYNLMGADLPTTWEIADNFYGSAYKGNEVIKGMKKGKVSASDFSAFMQSILDNTQNAEDRQWALEQLQNAPDYFFEENGTLMVNTAKMGLTKYQEYFDIMVRAYEVVRKAGAKEQEIYNALYYGSESLQNADIYNKDGTLNSQKLLKLADEKTKQGENIKTVLEKIQIGDQTLYDMLSSTENTDMRDKMITLLAETNWDYENLDAQLEEYFSHYGGGTVTIDDATGKIIFNASDSDEVTTVYKVGNEELTREEYSKWLAARAKAGIKDTDITEENAADDIHYNLGQQEITVAIKADGKVTYTAEFAKKTFVAETEEDLITALEAFDWVKPGASNSSSSVAREIIIDNVSYIINTDGTVTFKDSNAENADNEEIRRKLQEKFKKTPVEVEQAVEVTGTTQAKVNDLELTLAEGAKVTLNLANEILQLSQAIVSAEGTVNSLSITPTQVLALINTLVPKLSGTLGSAEYGEALNAILTSVNASFSGVPNIDNIQLSDVSYLKPVAATLLTLSLLTNNDTKSSLDSTVTINDKDFTISSIVHALLNSLVLTSNDTGAVPTFAENFTINDTTLGWTEALNAIITQLNLTGTDVTTSQGEITLGEGENQVHLNTNIIGLVLGLLLNWEAGANREPNMDALGIQTEYQAPDASITQNVSLKWNFTGEEAALNEMATEISNLISSSDLHLQNGAWQLDTSTIAQDIRRKVQEYIAMGGQRYQFDKNGNVIEFTGKLSTEEVEAAKAELESTTTEVPVETGELDTSSVDNWQPEAKVIPVKTEMGDAVVKGKTGHAGGVTYSALAEGGPALAGGRKGKTLMGELGPELYVTNGKYYIAGQNGAEFVNLPDDAIVFNHLQTKKLLDKGYTTNGKPFTSEGKAVGNAHAKGTTNKSATSIFNTIKTFGLSLVEALSPTIKTILKPIATVTQTFKDNAKIQYEQWSMQISTIKELNSFVSETKERFTAAKNDQVNPLSTQDLAAALKQLNERKQVDLFNAKEYKQSETFIKTLKENYAQAEKDLRASYASLMKASKSLDTSAKNMASSTESLETAAEEQTTAAKAIATTPGRRNEYSSQQESRGLVHPNGAYKLQDIFAGTGTVASVGNGARASGTNIYKGTGNTLGPETSQVLKTQIASAASGDTNVQKSLKEVKSAVSTFLSDLLSQGIEAIDLSKYDKLTKELASEIQAKINNGDNYRSFIKTYTAAMDKSMHEINATYFEAWQKDLEKGGLAEVQLEAMEGLSFFNNGEIAGGADDWTTILGDATFVGAAEESGILEWNAALRQYIIRDQKALEEFMNSQLDAIWNFPDAIIDGAQSVTDEINDLISKAMNEGLESKSKTRLQELLRKQGSNAELEFIRGTNGKYALTNASAKALAQETATDTSTSHQITDTSRVTAEEMLSGILQGVEDSHITKELGDQIGDWLQSQGKSLTDLGITETDTGYEIPLDAVLATLKTFGKDYQSEIIKIASGLDVGQLDESEINKLIKSVEEVGGQGVETVIANYKDKIVTKLNEALDAVSSGFGQDNIMSATNFETMKTNFADLDIKIDPSKFEAVEGGYKASWDTITSVYNAALLRQPEAAARWLKNFSNETLSSNEQRQKATLLKAAGDLQSSSETLDAITERAKAVGDILTSGFGGNTISFANVQAAQDAMKLMDINSSDIKFDTNEEGATTSFESILAYFKQIVDDAPAYAISMLSGIADDMLTKEQQLLKAEALSAANAGKESAEVLDAIVERVNSIKDTIVNGISGTLSNSDISSFKDNLALAGISTNGLDFKETTQGLQITPDAINSLRANLTEAFNNGTIDELTATKYSDALSDATNDFLTGLSDKISKGLQGTLSNADVTSLKEALSFYNLDGLDLQFKKTADGLKLSSTSAITLYTALQKVDKLQSVVVFKELRSSLEESNGKYKTMTSLIQHIGDLQQKITQTDKYSDGKIKQYKQELELAKQIAAIRATSDDESFDFINQDLPGGFSNPLNYAQSMITGWNEFRDAVENNSAIDFSHFYNMALQINQAAEMTGGAIDFFGQTLDGSLESFTNVMIKAADSMGTDESKNYGIMMSQFGEGLVTGADNYADSANNAIRVMAKTQIAYIDAAIGMFEMIVALESFDQTDVNLNGILDFGEIFEATGFDQNEWDNLTVFTTGATNAAQDIMKLAQANETMRTALESVRYGGYTLAEIFEDMIDGQKSVNIKSQDLANLISGFYDMLKNGDFDPKAPLESLQEYFAGLNLEQTITVGNVNYNIHYSKYTVTQNEAGEWITAHGQVNCGTSYERAIRTEAMLANGITEDKITWQGDTLAEGQLTIANTTVDVIAGETVSFNVGEMSYGSLDDAVRSIWMAQGGQEGTGQTLDEFRMSQGVSIAVQIDAQMDTSQLSSTQIQNIANSEWAEVRKDFDAAQSSEDKMLTFKAKYGIELTEGNTEEDWNQLKEMLGIESKTVAVNAAVHFSGDNAAFMTALETGELSLSIKAQLDESLNFLSGELSQGFTINPEAAEKIFSEFTTKVQTTTAIQPIDADTSAAENTVNTFVRNVQSSSATKTIVADTTPAQSSLSALRAAIENTPSAITVKIEDKTYWDIESIKEHLEKLSEIEIEVKVKQTVEEATPAATSDTGTADTGTTSAKGNVSGLAMAQGTKTLMGELGPELYVTGGHYYIAGRNGAEFVNLPSDAIVFNHLQTQRLLGTGTSGRGSAITSEEKAVAYASGSLGPAMASAQEVLATLKQLRAMWVSLADTSIVNLAGIGGSEASDFRDIKQVGSWLANVERWYNLMQRIAQLEKDINYQEALRRKLESDRVKDGELFYKVQTTQLANYRAQAAAQHELFTSQQEYFEQRRAELNSEKAPFSQFYTYDENGQLKYKPGKYAELAAIVQQDDNGVAKMSPAQQYEVFQRYGLGEYMTHNAEGLLIEWDSENDPTKEQFYRDSVQAVWERMEAEREEMQKLHESIEEARNSELEALANANEILQEFVDNQRELEDKILEAIESREQATIDKLTDERQALSDSVDKYVSGLQNALQKERDMYSTDESSRELAKMRRQLSILERTGGSASQIANLQQQIAAKEQDAYFDAQERSINAIQEASDLQLEKMQTQIDLLTEQLAYEKEHGLLWAEVASIMGQNKEAIVSFISGNSRDFAQSSGLAQQETISELLMSAGQWEAYYKDTIVPMMQNNSNEQIKILEDMNKYAETLDSYQRDGAAEANAEAFAAIADIPRQEEERRRREKEEEERKKKEEEERKKQQQEEADRQKNAQYTGYPLDESNSYNNGQQRFTSEYNHSEIESKAINIQSAINEQQAVLDQLQNSGSKYVDFYGQYVPRAQAIQQVQDTIARLYKSLNELQGYSNGGLVNYTGLAMVHGSPSRPEAFLNAKDTQVWKRNILSSSKSSLTSQLLNLQDILTGIENVSSTTNNSTAVGGTIIEHAEVNVHVDQLANDYDARRAGTMVMEQMLQIARKNGYTDIRR